MLYLTEFVGDRIDPTGQERGYWPDRFRPFVAQQDDIDAHFKALLDTSTDVRVPETVA